MKVAKHAKPPASSRPVDLSPPKPFVWVLCEELDEIRELRKNRQWDQLKGDTSRDPAAVAPCPPVVGASVVRCSDRDPQHPEEYANDVFKEAHDEGLVGLAFSGGGIRSATVNLGVLQGFA